jgi:oligopeptide/dipeptide ABC transporter ATP-binding protein
MGVLLSVAGLEKHFPVKRMGRSSVLKAVCGLTFDIADGEIFGVVGESGSGKSTLGRCILNLIEPTGGKVIFDGRPLTGAKRSEVRDMRRKMQVVFQNPFSSFNPKMTIGRTLRNVAKFYGLRGEEASGRIHELLDCVKLSPSMMSLYCNALSGGEVQRLAIVRALIPSPKFIMADEPVSALDVSVQAQILNLLKDLQERFGLAVMFISHDLTVVEHICDRIMVMYLGEMVEMGTAEDLFERAVHPYTRALISSRPKDSPDEIRERAPLRGEMPDAFNIPRGCRFYTRCPQAAPARCESPPPLRRLSDTHSAVCWFADVA